MTTDITPADLQNMTPEQLSALATAVQQEQAAATQLDTLISTAEVPASPPATTQPAQTPATQSQQEVPINPVQSAVLNGVNVATTVAQDVQPVVMAVNPAAGVAIETGVLIVNALEAIAGFLGLIPDGPASVGIKGQIAVIKGLIQQSN